MGALLVEGSLFVLRSVAGTLLPSTPVRAHYHFGYGDLVRVFKGILQYNPTSKSDSLPKFLLLKYVDLYSLWSNFNFGIFARLWRHEMTRVFCDRLVDAHDREFFHTQMRHAAETHFEVDILSLDEVVFGDFSRNRGDLEYCEYQPSHVKNLLKVVNVT
jgi:dynein heavy chain, axonemal